MEKDFKLRINKLVNYAIKMCDKSYRTVSPIAGVVDPKHYYDIYAPVIAAILLAATSDVNYRLIGDGPSEILNALIKDARENPRDFVKNVEKAWKEK